MYVPHEMIPVFSAFAALAQSTHPHFGSVVHAILFGRIDDGHEPAEEDNRPQGMTGRSFSESCGGFPMESLYMFIQSNL